MLPTPWRKGKLARGETSMSAEENMTLARRFMEAKATGDLKAMDEIMAPDYVNHTNLVPGRQPGPEGEKGAIAQFSAALSNISVVVEDQIAAGEKVVTRFTVHETHDRGELMGVVPSGREMSNEIILIHRIEGGKIVEEWSIGTLGSTLRGQLLEQERIERERIEQDLRVARSIQQASLPEEVPTLEGWKISPYYKPAREVGGDFYDFHFLSGERLGVVVGDATGKRVPAALVMSTTCGMLQLAARALDSPSPGEVLAQVNETLFARIPPNMFVTCFYAILDPSNGRFAYANAGHDLPYLRSQGGYCEELKARGMPLGLMPGMSYEEKENVLNVGEAALFYSDGLVEAHDPARKMFGFPRLQALVAKHGDEEGTLGDLLMEELRLFVGEGWEGSSTVNRGQAAHSASS